MPAWWDNFKDMFYRYCDDEDAPQRARSRVHDDTELFEHRNSMRIPPQEKPCQTAVVIPESPDEEWLPADYIKSNRQVLVNFKKLDEDERDQVRNFLIGVIYALDGTFTKLSDEIFLFAPKDVGIITKHDSHQQIVDREFFAGELDPEDLLH